jgi:hypothetical protein
MLNARSSPTYRSAQLERLIKTDAKTVGPTHAPTADMPVHPQKNQSLTDLLQAKPKTAQGRKFYHRPVLPDVLELGRQNCGAH